VTFSAADIRGFHAGVSIMKRSPTVSRSKAHRVWLIFTLAFLAAVHRPLVAQDYKFTIPTTQPWTDTGVDLSADDLVAIAASAASGGCDPQGVSSGASGLNLPVAAALPGALIARFAEAGTATAVGRSRQLRVPQAGRLFLGINSGGGRPCQGSFQVQVHIAPAGSSAAPPPSSPEWVPAAPESFAGNGSVPSSAKSATTASSGSQTAAGGEKDVTDIKGALTTAAQTWLSGQLGTGTLAGADPAASSSATSGDRAPSGDSTAAALPPLKLSTAPLDSGLRKDIDGLPRRVSDQFQNQGDMVNFVIIGSLPKVQDALTAADWHLADRDVKESAIKAVLETYEKKAYLAMPMSDLYLFGRVQDYGYEQAQAYAVVASRHHFRLWKAGFQCDGQDVWVGAGTHDIGFEKDQRNGKITHKIDPAVDGERENIGATLEKTGKVKSATYYLPPNPVRDSRNATGGGYHSDGKILVIALE
jgi:hypothetical protein